MYAFSFCCFSVLLFYPKHIICQENLMLQCLLHVNSFSVLNILHNLLLIIRVSRYRPSIFKVKCLEMNYHENLKILSYTQNL